MNDGPLIRLCGLYENVSKGTGKTYFSGVLGGAKVLLLRDDRAAEGQPTWGLFVAERPPKGQQPQAGGYQRPPAQRPPATRAPASPGPSPGTGDGPRVEEPEDGTDWERGDPIPF